MTGRARLAGPVFVAVLLCGTLPAWAQVPKVFKIRILTDAMVPWHSTTEGSRDDLKEFGYVEGKNVTSNTRSESAGNQ